MAVILNPTNAGDRHELQETQDAAGPLGLQILPMEVSDENTLQKRFAMLSSERAQALLILTDSIFASMRDRIVSLATASRLPAMYFNTVCRRWRSRKLWTDPWRHIPSRRNVCGENPQGRQTRRPSHRAAYKVRAGLKSENRQADRPDNSTERAGAGG